uniref:VaFE repeat-containing surface-anchored protein n=1 Tax=Acutalibacter intestini TaxID=3093659 RepID=UPI002AC99CB3
SYTFNASALAGKSVVVFEDLYEGESKVASHADIEDEGQTVTFTEPKIGTTATANGEHTAEPVGEITIIDTVKYSGLIPGKEYTVKGVLMDKATSKPLTVDGKEITAEATFRASKEEGAIDIPFTFAASALAGKTVVVFETLYRDKLEVCTHADLEDKDQTVTFSEKPEIKTTATVNGEKKAEPKGEVTITDTVSYTGLTPGKTYKLSGVLMDKGTGGKLLVNGKEVTTEKEFTPENASGTEEITFTFDASALAGKSVVVFETLYHEDKEIAVHADIDDEGQTVEFTTPDKPEIKTEATVNGEKEVDPLEEVTIIDTVSYSGLVPGKPYKISGILMDKSTREKLLVDGKEVTAEVEFTPENATGSVEIPFTFNASTLAGKSIVVFETLYQEDVEVFVHADINDKSQTITIRGLGGLVIKKTAEDNFVEGISFLITGKDYSKKFKTDKNGEIRVEGLAPGEYTVTEISDKVTARYEIQEGKTVTVTTGDLAEVKFHNKLLRGQIVGRKTDTEGNPLEGVLFGLFPKDAKEFTKEKAVATAKTDKAGKFQFDKVPYGDWQIVELEPLPGYVPLDDSIKVTVDSSTVTLEDIENAKTQIVISKVDSVTGKELTGAKLEIRDKDGKVVESWTTDGKPHTIEKLPAGEYVLHEASAPNGYLLAEDVKFTVKDLDEAITVVMKDRPKDHPGTPNTGDTGWRLALAVFGVSLGGVVLSLVISRKKKKGQD